MKFIGYENGQPVLADSTHPVDDIEPVQEAPLCAADALSALLAWVAEARDVPGLGSRVLGILATLRPDLAEHIACTRALRSKWAVCFASEFGIKGRTLRGEKNRVLMRIRTTEAWRNKRKSPPGEQPPNGDQLEETGSQTEVLSTERGVNGRQYER